MNNKLELINNLILEVEDLTTSTDEVKIKHYDCLQKIQNTKDEIKDMNDKWSSDRQSFEKEWKKKMGKFIYPFPTVFTLFLGIGFGHRINVEMDMGVFSYFVGFSLISVTLPLCDTMMDAYDIYFNYQSKHQRRVVNRWRKYLFKKYPNIEKMYKDLWALVDEITAKEKQLEEFKIDEKELQTKLQDICNLLSSKKDELLELEREYIDIVASHNITSEIDTEPTIAQGKVKIRVRKPEDN